MGRISCRAGGASQGKAYVGTVAWVVDRLETPRHATVRICRLQHLGPRPAGYPYPYPDFCWVIYRAEVGTFDAGARLADDYEQDARFYPPAAALALPLGPVQRALLARTVGDALLGLHR